jgi:hypothetical protein
MTTAQALEQSLGKNWRSVLKWFQDHPFDHPYRHPMYSRWYRKNGMPQWQFVDDNGEDIR